ncbi:bifunctional coenzyme A synthase-like [Mya arenaria]|uniref:bifunctional coenzyme A synthase-like n=1 Tax=Mya arenaria TaxID=6604 RepID=UPI0022E0553B|nr:bifunctional coenzyme A synthase-like [Mya arenaria]
MFKTALLVVTKPLSQLRAHIPEYLTQINSLVSKTAYVHIHPFDLPVSKAELLTAPYSKEVRNIIKDFYTTSSKTCSNIDVRVLVGHLTNDGKAIEKYTFREPCDVVLIDRKIVDDKVSDFVKSLQPNFSLTSDVSFKTVEDNAANDDEPDSKRKRPNTPEDAKPLKQYSHTVVGGTYDRLHVGHKLLLSEACALATEKLTVGVTTGPMLNSKVLNELIQPTDTRIDIVKQFLQEVKPSLEYSMYAITDGFGPTVPAESNDDMKDSSTMELIVLSQETVKGGEMINAERKKMGLNELEVYKIDLLEDSCHSQYEEEKVSSSSLRKRLLGTLFHPVQVKPNIPTRPYILGLTGGIASGKSSVCKRLEGQGARIVDCDKLGHRAYVKGTPGFDKIVDAFGSGIVGDDGEVNRRALGTIVFGNKEELNKLNQLVWPEIARLAQEQIQQYTKDGAAVVVLDAAVLLEAGWDDMCHEVWTTLVPRQEAIKRLVDRNKMSEDAAAKRLDSQISNSDRVARAHVILCTLWEYEYTQKQVETAWKLLTERLPVSHEGNTTVAKSNI